MAFENRGGRWVRARGTREAQSLVLFGTNSSSDVGQNGQGVRASTRLRGFGPTPGPVCLAKGARWACQEVRLVPAINVETCLLWGPTTLFAASPQPSSFHRTHKLTRGRGRVSTAAPSPCQTATAANLILRTRSPIIQISHSKATAQSVSLGFPTPSSSILLLLNS